VWGREKIFFITWLLDKMVDDKDFRMTMDAKVKTRHIFENVYKQLDYGNGRFVRNLLDKAVFRQASRIAAMDADSVNEAMLFELIAEDFAYEIKECGTETRKIGFVG
jgi:hypothetical protein